MNFFRCYASEIRSYLPLYNYIFSKNMAAINRKRTQSIIAAFKDNIELVVDIHVIRCHVPLRETMERLLQNNCPSFSYTKSCIYADCSFGDAGSEPILQLTESASDVANLQTAILETLTNYAAESCCQNCQRQLKFVINIQDHIFLQASMFKYYAQFVCPINKNCMPI